MESTKKHKIITGTVADMFLGVFLKVWAVILMMVMLPLLIAMFIITIVTDNFSKKCKFHKVCSKYSKQNEPCKNAGEELVSLYEVKKANCFIEFAQW